VKQTAPLPKSIAPPLLVNLEREKNLDGPLEEEAYSWQDWGQTDV
jgi:hypothetical protein